MSAALRRSMADIPPRRKRAPTACQVCHDRKVRCNVTQSGPPCFNCTRDRVQCQLMVRKKRGPAPRRPTTAATRDLGWLPELETAENSGRAQSPSSSSELSQDEAGRNAQEMGPSRNWELATAAAYSAALQIKTGPAPIYVGDERGFSFGLELCSSSRSPTSRHALLPVYERRPLPPDDLEYLEKKGAFKLPSSAACRSLIHTYFQFVHPFVPVVDICDFFQHYRDDEPAKTSLLLLWSMFFAASNFVDPAILTDFGCKTRMDLKNFTYQRAKALYDTGYEDNSITVVRSLHLLSHWFSSTDDRRGPWHWNGIAISLCELKGMNRNLGKPPDFGQAPAGGKDQPWANVWWCCYIRDVWASLFLGRPARVKSAESDAPMPDIDELPTLLQGLSAQVKEKYLPKEMHELLRLWRILLEITIVLEDVLTVCYRISSSTPANTGIGVLMDRFSACEEKLRTFPPRTSRLLDLQYYQLDIMMQAVKITLYKPYLLPRTEKATSQLHSHYPLAIQKVREAANEANAGLNKMATAGVIDLCQSSFIIALVPVMQIHLYDATSKDHLTKQLGLRRLEFCMTLCKELRKTFFGASVISSFFSGALAKMKENASASRDRLEGCQTPGESSPYRRPDFEVDIDNVEQPDPNVYGDGTASREQIPIAQTLEGRWAIDSPTIDQDGMMTLLLGSYGLTDLWNLQNDPSF